MDPSVHFWKANTDPSMHYRKANTDFCYIYFRIGVPKSAIIFNYKNAPEMPPCRTCTKKLLNIYLANPGEARGWSKIPPSVIN